MASDDEPDAVVPAWLSEEAEPDFHQPEAPRPVEEEIAPPEPKPIRPEWDSEGLVLARSLSGSYRPRLLGVHTSVTVFEAGRAFGKVARDEVPVKSPHSRPWRRLAASRS